MVQRFVFHAVIYFFNLRYYE